MIDLRAEATAALDLVGADPRAALARADAVVAVIPRQRRTPEESEALSVAHRAAGLALSEIPDMVAAEARLRTSARVAATSGDAQRGAEAALSLSFVLQERGRVGAALRVIDTAMGATDGVLAARLRSHRALALAELGRTDEALAEYAEALQVVRRAGDLLAEARLRNNRAPIWAYRGDFGIAAADLERARELFAELGLPLYEAQAQENLASLAGDAGRIPEALALLEDAEARFDLLDQPLVWMTRAELLLSVGLVTEAVASDRRAVEWLAGHRTGWELRAAQGHLHLAEGLLQAGDVAGATAHADTARRMFARQGRRSWQALADYVRVQAALLDPGAGTVTQARRAVSALEQSGWPAQSLDLRLSLADLARRDGDVRLALGVLGPVVRDPTASLEVQERAAHAIALRRLLEGDDRAFGRELRRAWELSDRRRSLLGATELRAASNSRALGVARLGMEHAAAKGSAREVFAWAERGRAATYRFPPVLPPRDEELAAALGLLRLAAQDDDDARLAETPDTEATRRRRRAEQRVVRLTRQATGSAAPLRPVGTREVADRLDGRVFLQFVSTSTELGVVVIGAGGSRLVRLGPVRAPLAVLSRARFALRRFAAGLDRGLERPDRGGPPWADLAAAAQSLDELLLGPVRAEVGDAALVVSPVSDLWQVPWSLLPTLRARPVSVAPSATLWARAVDRRTPPTPHVLVVAGPRLDHSEREAIGVASGYDGAEVLVGADASVAAVSARLPHADLAHLAVHGDLRADNPLFSALELSDGPLNGYDLERLSQLPHTVVLPACHAGDGREVAGGEMLGFCWTLLGAGAAVVVAPTMAVADVASVPLMRRLHLALRSGGTAAEALASAQAATDPDDPLAMATASAFLSCGA